MEETIALLMDFGFALVHPITQIVGALTEISNKVVHASRNSDQPHPLLESEQENDIA